uniref:Uncharacterized protein n=1 Tax=Panagrolaimus davidi TaxID=227884 RepID=A0A914PD51_9BILA
MNDDHTFIPQLNNPMPTTPTTPTTMPYYSDPVVAATHGTPSLTTSVSVAATPSVSSRSFGESHNNSTQQTVGDGTTFEIGTARDHVKQSIKQTTFNQHTTNFIVCCLDSLKPLNV